ncbi:MAG: type VI secretion system tube protein Hcp [Candidatus Peribacteraceae bacterium]|jgi:type VI secretion system secreted protein Hcp|nr:type VI secretion system tube protein Hcp [Candidatus Peribacteraceae bacterium]
MRKSILTFAILLALPFSADAAAFAKYDGVDGESKDADHSKWIDVLSIDWGVHKPGGGATGQSRRRGDVVVEDLTMTVGTAASSVQLLNALASGHTFPNTVVEFTQPCGSTGQRVAYLKYELTNVQVTSYSIGSSGQDGVSPEPPPTEEFALNFEEITWTYTAYDDKCQPGAESFFTTKISGGR